MNGSGCDDPLPEGEKTMDKLEVLKLWIEEEGHSCPERDACCQYGHALLLIEAIERLQSLDRVDNVPRDYGYPGRRWRAYWSEGNTFHSRDFEILDDLLFPGPEGPE